MDIFLLCTALKYTCFFFFNDTATTEIYTLSLHDALPICTETCGRGYRRRAAPDVGSAAPGYGGSASRSCEPASARRADAQAEQPYERRLCGRYVSRSPLGVAATGRPPGGLWRDRGPEPTDSERRPAGTPPGPDDARRSTDLPSG